MSEVSPICNLVTDILCWTVSILMFCGIVVALLALIIYLAISYTGKFFTFWLYFNKFHLLDLTTCGLQFQFLSPLQLLLYHQLWPSTVALNRFFVAFRWELSSKLLQI